MEIRRHTHTGEKYKFKSKLKTKIKLFARFEIRFVRIDFFDGNLNTFDIMRKKNLKKNVKSFFVTNQL